jgi:hypothetical protein
MPSHWTPKQERQYKHIKRSCVKRKCRRVRGKTQCVRTCTSMAAATTNKFRSRGLGATPKKLSKRLHVTLKDSAANYQGKPLGTNVLNNNLAAYELEKRGLVEIRGNFAFITPAGQNALRTGFGGLGNSEEFMRLPPFAWVVVDRRTGRKVFNTEQRRTADRDAKALNEAYGTTSKFVVVPYKGRQPRGRSGPTALGAVRGKCCVVRGKKRIACFGSRKDALSLKRSLKKTRGLRIRCV